MIGQTLGHYRIESKLGAGGMGVVYKARDTRLDRAVAIKVLSAEGLADPERRRRFVQEAKAASALNHPNIITIHAIDTVDGMDFIVMEYVPGKSLDRVIPRRGLPLGDALHYAIEIADALAAAQAAGIVHRDLKPGNIMVSDTGRVKVLDFGLAKLVEPVEADEFASTKTMQALTEEGVIVGTAAYMSPEQAEGKPVDARSDIFSFGSVLYEMVTGRRPFQGETRLATLTAILHQEPKPVAEVAEGVPPELERIITYCLRKDRQRRLQHMDDIKIALEGLNADSDSGKLAQPAAGPRTRPRRLGWLMAAGAVLVAAGAGAALWLGRSKEPAAPAPLMRLTSDTGLTTDPALSPDGKLVAYASDRAGGENLDIWVKQVEGGVPLRLTSDPADESEPSFSPDGNRIVFRSERDGGGIYTIPALGGEPRLIAKGGRSPRFSPDGARIAFVTGQVGRGGGHRFGLFVIPSMGGTPQELVTEKTGAASPVWSPDGRFILFSTGPFSPDDWGIVSSEPGAAAAVSVLPLATLKKSGLADVVPYEWPARNRVLFVAASGDGAHIFEAALSPPTGMTKEWRVDATPKRLTFGTGMDDRHSLASAMSGAGARRLAFASLARNENVWSVDLDTNRPGPGGKPRRLTQEPGFQISPSASRDGTKLAFISHAAHNDDIWLLDLKTGKRLLLSTKVSSKRGLILHPDGSRVAYTDVGDGASYAISTSGGAPEKLYKGTWFWDWSADHTRILHLESGKSVAMVLNLQTGKSGIFLDSRADLGVFRLSPDNRWILFRSRYQLFVTPFSGDQAEGEAAWIRVTDGSTMEERGFLSPDGNWIYSLSFRDGFECIWAYPIDPRSRRPAGKPVDVYHSHVSRLSLRNANQVSLNVTIARDKIVFNQGEITGNIWMTVLE
ncbi:MAG: serine/threonine-protein kinase [Acidobacteria bacterium]|nr:serine/threonine-protein kinase [Acidobacteriota bacterium]